MRILVVEDEPISRLTARELLAEAGYEVHAVGSGDEALDYLRSTPVTHLFVDIGLPGATSGMQLARVVAERWPEISIVMTSADVRMKDAAEHCARRFIPKPWRTVDVLNIVL